MTALNTIPAEENDTLLTKPKASAQEFRGKGLVAAANAPSRAKGLVAAAAVAALFLGALAAAAVDEKAPARSTAALYSAADEPSFFSGRDDDDDFSHNPSDWQPFMLWEFVNMIETKIVAAGLEQWSQELDMPADTFFYFPQEDKFIWKLPPFGGERSIRGTDDDIPVYVEDTHGGATPIDHYAVYNYDRWSLADKGLYKLWRDDGSAGGYYTVALKDGYPYPYLEFTCRANDSWDDLSDEC